MSEFGTDPVAEAMRYATRGGKRLRGFLTLEAAALFDVPRGQALYAAGAVECLHAYSLVHDDLPCMDDDDLRRGQPTVHIKWDEAIAVLVGDALQSFAFELLADPNAGAPDQRIELVATLAKASGAQGMVLGQAQDIAAETADQPLSLNAITELQGNKTGALITWPAEAGAILGRADPAPLRRYAQAIGLAFQIADDILDVEGDATKAGKRLQKDAQAGKATFVSLLGVDGAKSRASDLIADAESALDPYGERAETLKALARYIIARDM
ncbi:polyprenyl synthetase family protein [Roseobacter sp. HKCCD9010]|uniref:polyprenyl synthetase family protein n=1 Tax=unclassified Roseobacter TaxID=196798 RepID=UPI001490BEF7|nr:MULTISPECIES: farnesyl diphosphate synthase [unclassified Roseobacter]MBF9048520.1 polyprenyl synthetase family protein [Rhodobacterales bacterium HKCCD4356]NNV10519.1 polyprenyl synthetase family protein [Roseobacter sp. HKCCD7357]NNV14704.1 polyprenyl synthetase family protein [Roseobacter sp. HKCCD8768]NNV24163.1 polyprenyl synthetase family protein [Roseobacter sp. HKCCD8192]NNV28420.1 polyprenyl synthetase family protein [Roseobacter sp. HKCCD9061]